MLTDAKPVLPSSLCYSNISPGSNSKFDQQFIAGVVIMSPMYCIRTLLLGSIFLAGLAPQVVAQNAGQYAGQNVQLDCSAFQKGPDGSWIAVRQTTIMVGSNSISSSGKVTGSVNGARIQDVIEQQCSKGAAATPAASGSAASAPATSIPTNAFTSWKSNNMALPECLARARDFVQNFPQTKVAGQTTYAWYEGYTIAIRCVPEKSVVFFLSIGPGNASAELQRTVQGLVDQIISRF